MDCLPRQFVCFGRADRCQPHSLSDRFAVVSWLFRCSLTLLLLVLVVGCQDQSTADGDVAGTAVNPSSSTQSSRDSNATESAETSAFPKETWDVFYVGDARIGYGYTRYERVTEDGRPLIRITSEQTLTVQRFAQRVTQQIRIVSWETEAGRLVRFEAQMDDQTAQITSRGTCEGGELIIETTTLGKTQKSSLPWDPNWGGFFATEQRLEAKPLHPGEKRSFMTLMPIFNQVAQVDLEAIEFEPTEVLGEQRELLRVNSVARLAATTISSVIWVDRQGRVWKTELPMMNQVSYRTTRERALAGDATDGQFDLGKFSLITMDRPIERPHQTLQAVYLARLATGDPTRHFTEGWSQKVERVDEHTARITVRHVDVDTAKDNFPGDAPPTESDRNANNFIQSDDERVVAIARSVAPDAKDARQIATALEKWVHRSVRTQSLTQAVASAADVAQTLEGDCTEHAVLLAALCRARSIPARVAIGLVYSESSGGFAYHMWTEVWMGDHWVPLDATLGQGGVGAAHLKITHTNLEGSDSLVAFLPVFQLMGQLELELESIEYP